MSRSRARLVILVLILLTAPTAAQTTGTWQSTGNGPYNWTDAANWVSGIVPNGPFDTADMSMAALTGFPDISLNQQIQLRNLTFGSGANGYFFEPGTAGFFAFGSGATITAGSQGVTINAPITTSGMNVNTTAAGNTVAFSAILEPPANLSSSIVVKSGPGGLDFSNLNAQTLFVGIVVNGGFVQMENPTALEDSQVTVNVTNGLQFSTLTSATVGSVILSSNANLALTNSTPAAVALTLGGGSISGTSVVSGSGSLNVAAGSSQVGFSSSVAQTYSGGTTVSSGTLLLDFSNMSTPTNMLNPSQTLTLGAGQFQLNGMSNAASSQSFAGFSLAGGQASVILTPNGTGTMNLTLPNTWTRSPGGTVDFTIPTGASVTSAPVASGFIGAYATVNGGNDWASVSGGQIVPFSGYTNNTFTPGTHVNITDAESPPAFTVASIRMDDGGSLALSGTNTVTTGGVLVRANTISGGTLQGPASGELLLNTGTSGGSSVTSTIADNGGATALTVAGIGGITLGGSNTYSGPTYLNTFATIPALANGGSPSGIGQSSNVAGMLVLNGATLTATGGGFTDRLFTLGPGGGGFSAPAGNQLFFSNVNPIAFTGAGSRTLTLSGGSTDVANPNVFSPILDDPTGGTLGVTIDGGAWEMQQNNSFTGPLLVELNAILITNTITARGAIGPLGASNRPDGLIFSLGSTLQYTGGSVSTDRPILFQPGSLDVTTAGTNLTLTGGGIQGTLTLSGPGTVTFGGPRPFTGSVIINNGTAILADNNSFAGVTVMPNISNAFQFAPGVTTPTIGGFNGSGNINLQTTASETVNVSLVSGSNYSGVLSGPGSVTLTSGTHTFSGANTYQGGTFIQGNLPILVASNTTGSATGSGPVTITGGTLSGTGTVTGPVTLQGPSTSLLVGPKLTVTGAVNALNSSAVLQPGQQFNTVGLLNVGPTTLNGGANYIWAVNNWTSSPVAGTDFSQIDGGANNLNMSGASSSNPISLIIEGNPTGFNQAQGRSWLIASYGSLTNFSAGNWTVNSSNFTPAPGTSQFSLSQMGAGGILLTFTPVPEPWAVLSVCGLAMACWAGWRRRPENEFTDGKQ